MFVNEFRSVHDFTPNGNNFHVEATDQAKVLQILKPDTEEYGLVSVDRKGSLIRAPIPWTGLPLQV